MRVISKEPIRSVADAARYHDKSFNKDAGKKADNYYVNEKATAHWQGRGADFLGIRGKAVTKEEFIQFLSGRMPHPDTGKIQNLANNSKGTSAGRVSTSRLRRRKACRSRHWLGRTTV